ncbi:hypothetical protein HAX54_012875, partial [Datura stramonium]|nr:hypothetical protein [Datura stramonium]
MFSSKPSRRQHRDLRDSQKVLTMIKVILDPNYSCTILSASFHSFGLEFTNLHHGSQQSCEKSQAHWIYVNFMLCNATLLWERM